MAEGWENQQLGLYRAMDPQVRLCNGGQADVHQGAAGQNIWEERLVSWRNPMPSLDGF